MGLSEVASDADVFIAQNTGEADHFPGLDLLLERLGLSVYRPDSRIPWAMPASARVVVVRDFWRVNARWALEHAAKLGARTLLLMDGLCEWRNTYDNPRNAPINRVPWLRPAPVDVICCAGRLDAAILTALGNTAVATGLPRLEQQELQWHRRLDCVPSARCESPRILLATAKTPTFHAHERPALLASLRAVQTAAAKLGVGLVYRLGTGLDRELGVTNYAGSLADTLEHVSAVVTTPSTLHIEAMRAGLPTALLMPWADIPCWSSAAWVCTPSDAPLPLTAPLGSGPDPSDVWAQSQTPPPRILPLSLTLRELLAPSDEALERQHDILCAMDATAAPSAARTSATRGWSTGELARVIGDLASAALRATKPTKPWVIDTPLPDLRIEHSRTRVVNVVALASSPVGGVVSWALRLPEAMQRVQPRIDVHTLLVPIDPDAFAASSWKPALGPRTHLATINPWASSVARLTAMRDAIASLNPHAIIVNYHDLTFMGAGLLRQGGARVIAVSHTDEPYYADLLKHYPAIDAAVAVSGTIAQWQQPLVHAKPTAIIPCGATIEPTPRHVPDHGSLHIAYVGRMVHTQKRVLDLAPLAQSLIERRVDFRLHLVGDGYDQTELLARLERVGAMSHVIVHGSRDPEWVRRFWPTVDVSLLVSEFEGTSVTMLESMGAGVVPVVTRVGSGVAEWITEGVTGFTAPVGDRAAIADHLARLAADRPTLRTVGRAAWSLVRERGSLDVMAKDWAQFITRVIESPPDRTPSDCWLRPMELGQWLRADADEGDDQSLESHLRACGYDRIACGASSKRDHHDAVVIGPDDPTPSPAQLAQWRGARTGVVFAPALLPAHVIHASRAAVSAGGQNALAAIDATRRALQILVDRGATRIAVLGAGRHTTKITALFSERWPIVGFIDDAATEGATLLCRPLVRPEDALALLNCDAIVLSSDTQEHALWNRAAIFRDAGLTVQAVYATYPTTSPDLSVPQPGRPR